MFFKKIIRLLKNNKKYNSSYIIIFILFGIWMFYSSLNSWLIQRELNSELKKLQYRKYKLQKAIDKDQRIINQLENIDSLERFAREHYNHKKKGETIFLIKTVENDSL